MSASYNGIVTGTGSAGSTVAHKYKASGDDLRIPDQQP